MIFPKIIAQTSLRPSLPLPLPSLSRPLSSLPQSCHNDLISPLTTSILPSSPQSSPVPNTSLQTTQIPPPRPLNQPLLSDLLVQVIANIHTLVQSHLAPHPWEIISSGAPQHKQNTLIECIKLSRLQDSPGEVFIPFIL